MTTLSQHKAQIKAKRAAAKAAFIAGMGDYYADSSADRSIAARKRGELEEIRV